MMDRREEDRCGALDASYASATPSKWWQPAFSVDGFSRLDEILPAARIAPAANPSTRRASW